MFTRIWAVAALNRALRTLAQTAVALIGTTAVIEAVDWQIVASGAGLAAILSLLTSLAGLPEVEVSPSTGTVVSNMYISGTGVDAAINDEYRFWATLPADVTEDWSSPEDAKYDATETETEADAQSAGNDPTGFPYV